MTVKINEEDQKILKDALRCYRDKEASVGNDVRAVTDLIQSIVTEIKVANTPKPEPKSKPKPEKKSPDPRREYMDKIQGEEGG